MNSMNGTAAYLGIGRGSILKRNAHGGYECISDEVAIEEPLEIRVGDMPLAITMRTPGADRDLVAGFLLSEGIIHRHDDLRGISCASSTGATANVVTVRLARAIKLDPALMQRFGTISASCGLCGKTSIESIRKRFPPLVAANRGIRMAVSELLKLPDELRRAQGNFARTGGIHAAGIFGSGGKLLVLREDVGRHNAVDKAIGHALLESSLPLSDHVLLVSGRTSLEIVQKALAAGIPIVASVSAPSTLAINFARESDQTLIGFLRPPTFNVYAHVERLGVDPP